MKTKLFTVLIAIMVSYAFANAQISGTCGEHLTWSFNPGDSILIISGTGAMENYEADSIPWKEYKSGISYVIIDDNVTSIADYAFIEYPGLTAFDVAIDNPSYCAVDGVLFDKNITTLIQYPTNKSASIYSIPNSVTSIGDYAFMDCNGLTYVSIPNSVTNIGFFAFARSTGLTSIYIPNSVTSIGDWAFFYCPSLTSITIPDNIASIESYTFHYCIGLTSITIPNSVTSIGDQAFAGCSGLTSITCKAVDVPSLSQNIFDYIDKSIPLYVPAQSVAAYQSADGWSEFTNILPIEEPQEPCLIVSGTCGENLTWELSCDSVLTISGTGAMENYAWNSTPWIKYTSDIKNIIIGDNVTSIGDYAFQDCAGMTSITIPNGTTSIGNGAFYNCRGLISIDIPNSVTSIGNSAFTFCYSLTSITIPNGITSICNYTFTHCTSLTSITIPNNVTSIGQEAFSWCFSLTSITIPNNVTSIGQEAFCASGVTSMTCEAIIPPTLAYNVFDRFNKSIPLYVPAQSVAVYQSADGWNEFTNILPIGEEPQEPCLIASGTCGENLTWELSCDSVLTISGTGAMENYPMDSKPWMEYRSLIKNILIGDSVTSIGSYAFSACRGLRYIEIPNSVTSIGFYAFSSCSGLTSITIGNSVTNIGDDAFSYCTGLTAFDVAIANPSYCSIDGVLFDKNITTLVQYPSGKSDTNYSIPNSVTSIGNNAFNSCFKLTTIEIPNSVISIGDHAFYTCSRLTSLEIPNSVTSIGKCAFYACSGLRYIEIPNSVTSIGNSAFSICTSLTSITIPNSVISIGDDAFSCCTGLTAFDVAIDNPSYRSIDGVLFDKNITTLVQYPSKKSDAIYSIPNSVTSIGDYAFIDCTSLTSAIIHNSVTSIGKGAFSRCTGLTSMTCKAIIPPTLAYNVFDRVNKSIPLYVPAESVEAYQSANGWNEFTNILPIEEEPQEPCLIASGTCGENLTWKLSCDNVLTISGTGTMADYSQTIFTPWYQYRNSINSVLIGDSVTSIGSYAFEYCTDLTSANIGDSVISIGDKAFFGCSSLTSVTIGNSITNIGDKAFYYCTSLNAFDIPNSVTSIGSGAFQGCESLTSITIPDSVTSIEDWAFCGCRGLTSITIPSGVTSIGDYAFYVCNSLTSISIPNSVTSIGDGAFCQCRTLTSITIPNSVTSIGEVAFDGCDRLTAITIPDNVTSIGAAALRGCTDLTSVTIPNSVTSIGSRTFDDCTGLTSVTIGNGITSIGDQAFFNCTGLTSIVIPNSVTSIGSEVFMNCTSLTSVTIGNSVTNIGSETFRYCIGLTSITCEAVTVPSLGENVFRFIDQYIPLYVPEETIDAYQSADQWKEFYIIRPIGDEGSCFIASGPCGENLTWELSCDKVLTISGSGAMDNYEENTMPWAIHVSAIKNVIIGDSVTNIGDYAFCVCEGLTSITIPNSVTRIGNNAFYYCLGLTSFDIATDNPSYCSVDGVLFDKNIATLIQYPASKSSTIYSIPNSVTSIGEAAFIGCTGLTSIEIPNSVTNIGQEAFLWCLGLTSIVIPNSVTSIGNHAFDYCDHLTSITCGAIVPPTLEGDVFYGIDKSIPLYVPAKSIEAYRAANVWSEFTNILPIEEWDPEHPNNPGNYRLTLEAADTLAGYTIGSGLYEQGATAHIEAVAGDGYRFVKWSDNDSSSVRDIVITRDCTLIADFTEQFYSIQFENYDHVVLQETNERYGTMPAYQGETPVHPASNDYEYSFAGWEPEIESVTQDIVYTALFDSIFLGEEIIEVWGNHDITELPVGKRSHIIVAPYGELHVSQPTMIKVLTIKKDTVCGQVYDIERITAETIDMIQTFTPNTNDISSRWFAFGVPFEVSVSTGISKANENTPAIYGRDFVIDEYDGVLRADTQDGWRRIADSATLYPGKLYMLASREASEWRFTAAHPSAINNNTRSVPVLAYPSAYGDHHAGWNGIANPMTYKAYADALNIQYATIYHNYYGVYQVVRMDDSYLWKIGEPFFVQTPQNNRVYFAAEGSTITYDPNSQPIPDDPGYAPLRMRKSETSEPVIIELASTDYADKAYVNTVTNKDDSYTIGWDLEKLQVSNPSVPQVWIEAYGTHLAAHAISTELEATPLTLGFYAPSDGTYSLSISNLSDSTSIQLTLNGSPVSNLSNETCEIQLHAGVNANYGLILFNSPQVGTAIEETFGTTVQTRKFIRDGQVLILRGDKIYTLTGQEVR